MEEDGDDLDNLFDGYESDNPQREENANNENAENEDAVPEKVPVPKRVVKHPRLKFNPERLCGKRGIPILVDHFKDVKFKGKGHEKENLKKLLTTLELWTHRLFPSMKFEDCLRQIEHLGKKRPVKTCLQKIRLDFPILAEDFVRDEEEQEQPNEVEPEPPAEDDAFDRLFDDYQERDQPVSTSIPSSSQTAGNVLGTSFGSSFSEEQKKRMEYNKMLAIERRKSKLSEIQTSSLLNSTDCENTTNMESVHSFSTDSENTTNMESLHSFSSAERIVENNDSNFLLEVMESVHEGGTDKTSADVFVNVRNNDYLEGKDKEELGLDELMDLVDEDDRETNNSDTLSSIVNNEVDKNEIDVRNDDCPDGNDEEQLGLDKLMDLVGEGNRDEIDHCTMLSCVKDDKETDSLLNDKNNDCSEGDEKEELGLDELMDLVD